MDTLLILIASPSGAVRLDQSILDRVAAAHGLAASPRWLAPGLACEWLLRAEAPQYRALEDGTRALLGEAPIDVAVIPAAGRRKSVLVADMDSTMIGQECIDELAVLAGVGDRIAEITARAMRGELEFEQALEERVAMLAGLPEAAISQVIAERLTFMPGGHALVRTMRAHGATTALISGGFTAFTAHVASQIGFDLHRANTLLVEDGRLSGRVALPILGRNAKLEGLLELCAARGVTPRDAITVGDGANDIPMLEAAGLGVALHAKPKTRDAASVRIDHGDLTALLYLQGYTIDEFAD